MKNARRRYYRDHKYVIDKMIDCQQLISRTDFRLSHQTRLVITEFRNIVALVECHAEHEHKAILEMLFKKDSHVAERFEADHARQHELFKTLILDLDQIELSEDKVQRVSLGYKFYLNFMLFFGDSLKHMHAEETIVMPELQRLYSDDELRAVDFNTYDIMTPQEMLHMFQALFPHIDANDREVFITDIHTSFPEKLAEIWPNVEELLHTEESHFLMTHLNIKPTDKKFTAASELYYAWENKPVADGELVLTQHQRDNKDFENTLKDVFEQSVVS